VFLHDELYIQYVVQTHPELFEDEQKNIPVLINDPGVSPMNEKYVFVAGLDESSNIFLQRIVPEELSNASLGRTLVAAEVEVSSNGNVRRFCFFHYSFVVIDALFVRRFCNVGCVECVERKRGLRADGNRFDSIR
jgi:hypothetical protein